MELLLNIIVNIYTLGLPTSQVYITDHPKNMMMVNLYFFLFFMPRLNWSFLFFTINICFLHTFFLSHSISICLVFSISFFYHYCCFLYTFILSLTHSLSLFLSSFLFFDCFSLSLCISLSLSPSFFLSYFIPLIPSNTLSFFSHSLFLSFNHFISCFSMIAFIHSLLSSDNNGKTINPFARSLFRELSNQRIIIIFPVEKVSGDADRPTIKNTVHIAQSIFPSILCTAFVDVIGLLDDHAVSLDGTAVYEVAYQVIKPRKECYFQKTGLGNVRLVEHIRPAKHLNVTCQLHLKFSG